jgi:hypothetical protein
MFKYTDKVFPLKVDGVNVLNQSVAGLFKQYVGFKVTLSLMESETCARFELPLSRDKATDFMTRGYLTTVDTASKTITICGYVEA